MTTVRIGFFLRVRVVVCVAVAVETFDSAGVVDLYIEAVLFVSRLASDADVRTVIVVGLDGDVAAARVGYGIQNWTCLSRPSILCRAATCH